MQPSTSDKDPARLRPKTQPHLGNPGPSPDRVSGKPPPNDSKPSRSKTGLWLLAIAAVAVAGLMLAPAQRDTGGSAAEQTQPAYQKHLNPSTQALGLAAKDLDQRATDQARQAVRQGKPIPGLPSASAELKKDAAAGKVKMYSIRFYDTVAVDGDHIRVSIDGAGTIGPFLLTHAGTIIRVPVTDGKPLPRVMVEAVKDGNGGVTVGAQASTGVWYSSVLAVGQSQQVPLLGK